MSRADLRIIAWICGIVAVASLCVFFAGVYVDTHVGDIDNDPATHFPILKDDSIGYVQIANNLATLHRFTSDGSTPEVFRTPGYPLFIVGGELFGGIDGVVVLQILCLCGICALTFLIGQRLYGRSVGIVSALIFGLSPNALFHTDVILSDIPFTFFLILAVYLAFFAKQSIRTACLVAIALAIVAYLRPIGLYLPVVFVPFLLYRAWQADRLRDAVKQAGVLCLLFIMLVAPWLVRNEIEAGSFSFSSVSTFNFAYANVPAFLAERYGEDSIQYTTYENEIGSYSLEYLKTFAAAPFLKGMIASNLSGNLVPYAIYHLESTSKFFLSSSVRYVVEQVEIPALQNWFGYSSASPDLLSALMHGKIALVAQTVQGQFLITIDRIVMIILTICAFAALFIRRGDYFYTLLFIALLLYFALLTGPVSVPRYRLPIEPFMYLLSFSTIATVYTRVFRNNIRSAYVA